MMAEEGLPDFSGKVVYVQLPADGYNWTLAEPRFERQGGVWVLVGKPFYEDEDHWARGATVGIRWKYVAYYAVFDSIEAFRALKTEKSTTSEAPNVQRKHWLGRHRDA